MTYLERERICELAEILGPYAQHEETECGERWQLLLSIVEHSEHLSEAMHKLLLAELGEEVEYAQANFRWRITTKPPEPLPPKRYCELLNEYEVDEDEWETLDKEYRS